ncbi:MFS transporter [Marinobacterium nitratireducens]|uniref:MFS transporter n=1 Tax=Marinobacterium nitratireducens TaxID=518897 RepID=A0A918DXC0_9GAMM|nr:alpha-ketoacid dehydrogenase subunit alpha/beta [Marinobacterium nitratireducens]GGO86317.1 MFS transporter [Marinobacterium nitratireducens]
MPKAKKISLAADWLEIQATSSDWDAAGKNGCLKMLSHMHLIRSFEEALLGLEKHGLVHGPLHVSVGQEGAIVGALSVMRDSDLVNGSHRGHHLFLAKALNYLHDPHLNPASQPFSDEVREMLYRTMAEIMGLSPGYCNGRGGSMHLRWEEAGVLGTNAIVGGAVPIAAGAAWSKKRDGDQDMVLTSFGDGSCHIGNVLETLNLSALYDLPLCFYIENNGYAVSTTVQEQARETRMSARGLGFGIPSFRVDGMDPMSVRAAMMQVEELLREGRGPAMLEVDVYRYYHHSGGIKGSAFGYRDKAEEEERRKHDPIERMEAGMLQRRWITEEELAYLRDNAAKSVESAVERLTQKEGSRRTIKAELWPDPKSCDEDLRGDLAELDGTDYVEEVSYSGNLDQVKFIETIAKTMVRRFEEDDRYYVLGEDVHKLKGGTNGATKGIPERWPDRCVPTPIAEHGFVGMAGGTAMVGKYRPIVELMYPDFALVAADQLFNQIAKARHMFGGKVRVPLVLRTKVAIGTGYGSQHSMDPAGLFSMWPGWRIVAPSTPFDYVGLMNSALKCEDPVLVIESVDLYGTSGTGPVEDFDYFIELGKAKVVRSGRKFTVLTYLNMVSKAAEVCEKLGIDAEIIDLRSLDRAGIDWDTLGESIRKTNHVVVLEQGSLTNSYGGMLADEIQKRYFDYLDHPVRRIYGGESSPSVSKVLERAAYVGEEEITAGFQAALADMGAALKKASV